MSECENVNYGFNQCKCVEELEDRVEALEKAAREAVDAVRFQKPEHERAAIDALAALLEKNYG